MKQEIAQGIAVLFGTRPEIVKLAPVVDALGDAAFLIHSRQHYDPGMSSDFLDELGLPQPALTLEGVGGNDRATQIGTMTMSLAKTFGESRPGALVVQGDTNTVIAGALAANIAGVPIVHVEAGLRSGDRSMPEEINRKLTATLADVHCAPTEGARFNLLAEGVPDHAIHVTGNSVVGSCERTLAHLPAERHPSAAGLGSYILATIHRPENTDDAAALARALSSLAHAELPVVFVAHPRTIAAVKRFGLSAHLDRLRMLPPASYEDFLRLARDAALIVTDSGGIQEEVTVMRKPLLLVRRNTERPEAIETGFVRLVPPAADLSDAIVEALLDTGWEARLRLVESPFGDGDAGARIASCALRLLSGLRAEATRG
jgi:UDP-N-acetylglucosamine 2-epimerase (non-hydrolysing)